MEDIKRLLKTVSENNSNDVFKEIASRLINEYVIVVEGKEFFMTELEFYYHSTKHPDPYVHKSEAQQEFGGFYVHKQDGYRGGIDLTLGDKDDNIFCGVLLRGLKGTNDTYISGSNTLKRNVFYKRLNVKNHVDLQRIINSGERVRLEKNVIKMSEKIYSSTRINLVPKFEDFKHGGKYIYKLHRFIAYKEKEHKYKQKGNVASYERL